MAKPNSWRALELGAFVACNPRLGQDDSVLWGEPGLELELELEAWADLLSLCHLRNAQCRSLKFRSKRYGCKTH